MAHKPWHPGIARSLVLVLIIFRQQCASSSCRFAVKRPFCRRFGEPQDPRRSDLSVKLCQLECSQLSSCVGISHDGSDCDLWTSDCDFGALGAGSYSLMSKGCFRSEIQSPSFGRFSALQAIRRVAVVATGGINDVRLNALQLFAQQLRSGIGSTKYLLEIIPYPSDEAHLRHALQNDHVDAMLGPWGKSEDDQLLQHLADLHRPKVIVAGLEGSNTWPKVVNLHSNLPQHITEMLLRSIGLAGLSLALVSSTSLARHCQVAPQFLEDLGISVILNSSLDSDPNWQGLADNLGSAQPDLLLVCLDDLAVQRLLTVMKTMGGGGFFPKALLLPTLDVARSDLPELTWSIGADCWLEGGPLTFRPSYSKAQFIQDYQRQFYASPPLAAAEAYAAAELMVLALEGGSAMASYPTVNTVLGRLDMSSTTPLTCATVQLLPAVSAGPPRVVTVGPDTYQAKDRDGPVYPAPSWQVRNCTSPTPRFYGWGFLADDCVLCAELLQESAWSSETQRRECRDCGAGETYIRLSEDQGSCFKRCNAGYFDSNGTCTSCAPGSFRSEGMAAHQCVACPAGRFSSEAAASCIPCMAGYAAPTLGMHSCEACRPGFFSALEGAKFCGACLEGHFSGAFASSRCEKCPAGTASKLTGSSVCEDCPPGSYSEGLRCTLCPVGQYQHLSRQTKCLEDGLGMLSPEPGLAVPSNTKHFFLLRYLNASRGTPPVQLERCMANPEVCLENEACEVGHSGRQCFTCLPGFVRVTANSCSRCPDRFYGIFFATIYFFGYVLVIHMLMLLADLTNLKDCHLMLLKILLNHCIAMAVLGSQMWRYLTEAGLFTSNATLQWLMELIVATDGAPQGEASWFSLSCLMQPSFATPWIDRLANAKHHELEELQSERGDLAAYQYLNEVFVVLTWNALPVLVVLMSCIACCAILDRYMRSRMHLWPKAVDFYAKVSIFGSAVAHFWHVESHTVYIQLARKRVLGLFWPLKYANSFARSSWPVLKHRTFLADHAPARTAVFHLMHFAVARRNLQVFTCEVLGEAHPARVLRKQGAVECRVDDPLVATCIALAAMWAIVYPVVTMFFLRQHVKSQNRQASPSWAIQLNGYAVWWWEAVIYLRKLGFLLLELVPGSKPKIFCFTVCCLAALHAQEIYRPFDDRQGDLLNRIERYQLWSTLTPSLATLLAFELDNSRTSSRSMWSAIVVLCFVSHVLFIIVWIFHFFQNPLRRTAFWMAQWTPSAEKGWYLRNLILLSRSWWESSLRAQPYLAFHSLHGFVTVSGSGGDKALVPHLPQGHELPEVLLNSDEYRLRFSSVPSFLGEDIMPSSPSRLLVHKYLMSAVKYVVTNCHTISSSLLDFVLRAAFVLHKELVSAKQARMVATDVARPILDRASEDKNPVLLRDEEEASESSDDETDAAKELHSKAAGRALEKELREHPEMLMEWQDFEDLKALAKELQAKGQGVTAKDLAIQHESQETPRTQVPAPVDSVKIRSQQVDDVERTYRKKVSAMFSQWTFQHGMTLVDLRQGLALLRQVPPMELQVWLDAFERQWIPELLSSDRVIRRPAILEEEEAQAIKAVIESTFTGRAVTRRTRIQNVQMKKNWEVALEKEETKLEVALKWTRLLFWAYCGRFFVFKIAHLKCITQREKRQQQSFAATLQAPNLETMKLEPESQEVKLHQIAAPAVRQFEVKKSVLLASDQARAKFRDGGSRGD